MSGILPDRRQISMRSRHNRPLAFGGDPNRAAMGFGYSHSRWERPGMKIRTSHNYLIAALVAAAGYAWPAPSSAQEPHPGEPGYGEQLIKAVLASPGVLGV